MRTPIQTRWLLVVASAALAGGCDALPRGRPVSEADGLPASRAPVIQRRAEQPSTYTDPYAVRTAPRVLSCWVPPHVSDGRLIGGHTIDFEVEASRWWTEAVRLEERPAPRTAGPMTDRNRTRPAEAIWTSRGAFIPWRSATP